MGILTWVRDIVAGRTQPLSGQCALWQDSAAEYMARDVAFATAAGKVARSLAKCEIKTYANHEEKQERDYYRLNIEPNRNQNSSAWMQELIWKLYRDNEALVIDVGGQLLIADSYAKKTYALRDWQFSSVSVGDLTFDRMFYMPEVLYFRLNNENVRSLVDALYRSYAGMMAAASEMASSAGKIKGIINMPGMVAGAEQEKKTAADIMNNRFKPLFASGNAVVPLPQGFSYQDIGKNYADGSSREYRAMIDDVMDITGAAFGIPSVLLKGQTAGIEEAFDMYLTDCIDPLADLIETEINRQMYGQDGFLSGYHVRIDTSQIKHFELFDAAGAVEKLIGSGAMTINDIRPRLGLKKTDDPVGDQHLITKNFGTAEEVTKNETDAANT